MSRLFESLLALTLAAPAFAQGSQSMQSAPVRPQQPGSAVTTLRTGTKLIVVDVVVTDKKHKPVHNLKAGDFTLLENNASQTVKSFEEHTAPTAAELQKIEPMVKMPIGIFTNFTPAPALANGPVNIILLDPHMNTQLQDQGRVHAPSFWTIRRISSPARESPYSDSRRILHSCRASPTNQHF